MVNKLEKMVNRSITFNLFMVAFFIDIVGEIIYNWIFKQSIDTQELFINLIFSIAIAIILCLIFYRVFILKTYKINARYNSIEDIEKLSQKCGLHSSKTGDLLVCFNNHITKIGYSKVIIYKEKNDLYILGNDVYINKVFKGELMIGHN
ncbi:hypothetical protein [Anaerosporobacter sp.]|uniref:hypothetical protein n=1 Tax=Anaerosporobacter sp. TaxID=1872529 RepID=UPI00286EC081|nr:hypothetical protein [Anaerosporobacter sp.]